MQFIIAEKWIPDTNTAAMSYTTMHSRFSTWMYNTRMNMQEILSSPDIRVAGQEEIKKKGSAIVIGAGPSIYKDDFMQLRVLAESGYAGTIIACDRVLPSCLERGIVPDYVVTIDAKGIVESWLNAQIVKEHMGQIRLIAATHVHPNVIRAWKGEKFFCIGNIPDKMFPNVIHTLHTLLGKTVVETGGLVGFFAWMMARGMRKDPIGLIGMDMSYLDGVDITKTQKFLSLCLLAGGRLHFESGEVRDMTNLPEEGTYLHFDTDGMVSYVEYPGLGKVDHVELPDEAMERVKKVFKRGKNPYWKNHYIVDPLFESLAEAWIHNLRFDKNTSENAPTTVNCTGRGSLCRKPIVQMSFKKFLERYHA